MSKWCSDLNKVKEGDYIATIPFGWVKVVRIDKSNPYSIRTKLGAFMKDGTRQIEEKAPSAFIKPPEWLEEIIGHKPCEFKKDDQVLVSNDKLYWTKRYFSHVDKDGCGYYCFKHGRTSWSAINENDISFWEYCKKC